MNRIIEISNDGRHISADRGFMVVSEHGSELGRVPFDQIDAVIANAHGITYSNNLLVRLAEQNAPLVICGANHSPVAVLISLTGHHLQSNITRAQAGIKETTLNRLWKDIVAAKIKQQAAVLKAFGLPDVRLNFLAKRVKSGDPENFEGQAARYYFQTLFGPDFRRDRNAPGINALLNYGYIILRSAVIRSIVAAGLQPALGIHHHNQYNPMCLADDLIEPFRPIIDFRVRKIVDGGNTEVTPEAKRQLVAVLSAAVYTDSGAQELNYIIQRLATSLAGIVSGQRDKLELPPTIKDVEKCLLQLSLDITLCG